MTGVAVFGALHHDVVVDAPGLPRVDETLVGTGVDYRSGGKGGNQAMAAAQMGATVAMFGRVGKDAAAATVLSSLAAAGVDCQGVLGCDVPTGMSVAISLPDGSYGAVIVSGANLENDGAVDWSMRPAVAVIQNEVPGAANARFVESLPDNCSLIWNAAPARELNNSIAEQTDLLVVNRIEATDLSGTADPKAAAVELGRCVRGEVIVTLGEDGLMRTENDTCRHAPARQAKVVSTHGAGDMFVGALAARLATGDTLKASIDFSQAAASLFVASALADRARLTTQCVLDKLKR